MELHCSGVIWFYRGDEWTTPLAFIWKWKLCPWQKLCPSLDFTQSVYMVLCHEVLTQASSPLGCIVFYIFRGFSEHSISLGTLRTRISPYPHHGTLRTNCSHLLKTVLLPLLEWKKNVGSWISYFFADRQWILPCLNLLSNIIIVQRNCSASLEPTVSRKQTGLVCSNHLHLSFQAQWAVLVLAEGWKILLWVLISQEEGSNLGKGKRDSDPRNTRR